MKSKFQIALDNFRETLKFIRECCIGCKEPVYESGRVYFKLVKDNDGICSRCHKPRELK